MPRTSCRGPGRAAPQARRNGPKHRTQMKAARGSPCFVPARRKKPGHLFPSNTRRTKQSRCRPINSLSSGAGMPIVSKTNHIQLRAKLGKAALTSHS
eukprot:9141532-Lingulodinium_polyedra.AAC.1